jgi:hypothetical protein
VVEIDRDGCLHQSRPGSCLFGETADVGQSSGNFLALRQQKLHRLDGDVVPRDSVTSTNLLRQLEATNIGVQRVGDEVTAQSPAGRTSRRRFEATPRRMVQRSTPRSDAAVVALDLIVVSTHG